MKKPGDSALDPGSNGSKGSPIELSGGSIEEDPLLGSDGFIDPEPNDDAGGGEFTPGVAIAAQPISMYVSQEESEETAAGSAKRRNHEEMSKKPSWLPEDWTIDLKERVSGATKGKIDRYYVEPTGQRRFRSENEVNHFLETGGKLKRKATSAADATASKTASVSPGNKTRKKSAMKRKNSSASSNSATKAA